MAIADIPVQLGQAVLPTLLRLCTLKRAILPVLWPSPNESPEHVQIIAQILGHASMNTTEQHYIQAQGDIATARYHDQVLAIRAAESGGRRQRDRIS